METAAVHLFVQQYTNPCHYLHEEVGDPQRVEKIARTLQLIAVVFLQVQEGNDVCVPRLQIHRD